MTITFKTENDVIIFGLERIIFYTKNSHYIFLTQSVWWIASIIGLQQGLINYSDNLQSRVEITIAPADQPDTATEEVVRPAPDLSDKVPLQRKSSPALSDLQEDLRLGCEENYIHPDRRNQVENTNLDISDLDLNATDQGPCSEIIASTKDFFAKSRMERKAFTKQKKVDQLSRTRSGKILAKPLSQGQKKYLQCIPKDTITEYLANRKHDLRPWT
jgi:hypothetical protein